MYRDPHIKALEELEHQLPLSERSETYRAIRARSELLQAGVDKANKSDVCKTIQESLSKEFGERFQFRWHEEDRCWVLDKFDNINKIWIPLYWWRDQETNVAKPLNESSLQELLAILHKGDMQRFKSPEEFLRWKREQSAKVRAANEKKADAKLIEVVDSLSSKQVDEFIAVERAMKTGERIRVHGETADFLNKAYQNTRRADAEGIILDNPAAALNPGQNPLVHRRKAR